MLDYEIPPIAFIVDRKPRGILCGCSVYIYDNPRFAYYLTKILTSMVYYYNTGGTQWSVLTNISSYAYCS